MKIPNLRSPREKIRGIFYFARMIDKARLHAAGQLTPEYVENLGTGFDGRCCSFLEIDYSAFAEEARRGGSDEALMDWAYTQGRQPTEEQIEVWNDFMRKRGWNDEATERLKFRNEEAGFANRPEIQTFFDYIEADEELL